VAVFVLRAVERRRPMKTKNRCACETVNFKICNSARAQYGLYLSVIEGECVTKY
jgi:hypothetical protein